MIYSKNNVPDGNYLYSRPSWFEKIPVKVFTSDAFGDRLCKFNNNSVETFLSDIPADAIFELKTG
jgi:hypothetical protein